MESIPLPAPDISCDHCKVTVEREVATLPKVQKVVVDVPTQQVSVTYDPASISCNSFV